MAKIIHLSNSLEDTSFFGKELAKKIKSNSVIAFYGPLGSGKTTLIKEIVSFWGIDKNRVTSPTFNYLHIYSDSIFHFDLYRIGDKKNFEGLGFEEYFGKGIVLIEWAEKIEEILPQGTIKIYLSFINESSRKIVVFI